jgi:subtilisin family serine protease
MVNLTFPLILLYLGSFITKAKANNFDLTDQRGAALVPGQIVGGSFLVQLADTTNATDVRSTAVEMAAKMQSVKQLLIANGTLSRPNVLADAPVSPSLIFTETIKGFLMKGVPQEIYSMLLKTKNVIRVEPDRVVSINQEFSRKKKDLLSKQKQKTSSANPQRNRLLQSKSQVLPWGIKRIGGPIKPNPNPNGKVFIIDTGIAPVKDLNIDKTLSINFADWYFDLPNPQWYDGHGHGTHVAGTVAAIDNDINVVGVEWLQLGY